MSENKQPDLKSTTFQAGNYTWDLTLNYKNTQEVQKRTDFDIGKVFTDDKYIFRLYTEPLLIAKIVVVLCEPQYEKKSIADVETIVDSATGNITEKKTYRAMNQDDFEAMLDSEMISGPILDALINALFFSCPLVLRDTAKAMVNKTMSLINSQSAALSAKINSLELDETMKNFSSEQVDRALQDFKKSVSTVGS